MNTTEQGTLFERYVLERVKGLLAKGEFSITGPFYEIFHQKGYYSADRMKDIVVDVSIEFRRTKDTSVSQYVFIECKDYSSAVPAGDVEEFYAKTQQISGLNVKGVFFSRSNFQEGAFNFAKAKGIAIIRVLDENSLSWLVERTNRHLVTSLPNAASLNVLYALLNEHFVSTKKDTFALVNNKTFQSIDEVFKELLLPDKPTNVDQ